MSDPYLGKEVAGQFRIVEKIGKGGMGAVYKAEQPDMNRYVAIKILHPQFNADEQTIARFRREAQAARAPLPHSGFPPNTVSMSNLKNAAATAVASHRGRWCISQVFSVLSRRS